MTYPLELDLRRIEVADAGYEIVAEQCLDKLTVRALANAMDCSTAVVSY